MKCLAYIGLLLWMLTLPASGGWVNVAWDPSPDATGYILRFGDRDLPLGPVTNIVISNLVAGHCYPISIVATNQNGQSERCWSG